MVTLSVGRGGGVVCSWTPSPFEQVIKKTLITLSRIMYVVGNNLLDVVLRGRGMCGVRGNGQFQQYPNTN